MKSLLKYIEEKLFHQQVDEKLIVNKDYTNPNVNEEFYIKFKKAFEYLSNNHCWSQYVSVEDIRDLRVSPKYQINIGLDFRDVVKNKKGKQIYKATFAGYDDDAKLYMWKEMIKYIWDNEDKMNFIMSEDLNYGAYFIREFETQDWIMCFIGPEKVTNMSENGHLLFAWK